MSKNKLVYMLGLAPLLLGASDSDYVDTKLGALNVTMALPKCGPNEYLSYQGAGLICKSFEAGNVKVIDCNSTNQLLTYKSGGEFADFSCADKGGASIGQTEITSITNLTTISTQIRNNINNISTNPPAAAATYVGSVGNTKGRITSGNKVGLQAAAELCNATYTGARMCTVYDIYNSVATGVIKETDTINKAWVYMAAWNNPQSAAFNADEEGDAGMNENCAGYHYLTADQKWVGVAFAWQNIGYFGAANEKGLKFYSGSAQAACSQMYPIACCK